MNVSLTPTLENYVKDKVASGLYNNASEVMREALRMLRENEIKKQQLFNALDIGYDAYKKGEYVEYDATLTRSIADKIANEK